ncbi:tRNA methyltransferase, has a role in tRNA modification [Sporothrix eucalyptigena]|uniref:tRNA methyltransferase, has a role in tRNA modification n=1 Tax=Sporothrix eucalyptigena TaxID=1812306 RepID=A0ABP0BN78_9PEZI
MAEDRPQDPVLDAQPTRKNAKDNDVSPLQQGGPDLGAWSINVDDDASHYEQTHVHAVYESIADHFSATRYAPWPLVAQFLSGQPAGSIGLDVGCGNGKYLSGASGAPPSLSPEDSGLPQLFILGSDRSEALAKLAYAKHAQHQAGADVLLADSLALPFRDGCADFIICIAVVHHLSTRERRQAAVEELLRCVRRPEGKKGKEEKGEASNSKPDREIKLQLLQEAEEQRQQQQQKQLPQSTSASASQSPLVPTTATTGTPAPCSSPSFSSTNPSEGPASSSPLSSAPLLSGRVLLYVWALEQASSRRGWAAGGEQDLLVPWVKTMRDKSKANKNKDKDSGRDKRRHKNQKKSEGASEGTPEQAPEKTESQQPHVSPTFHRYYHLYKQGELEDDVAAAGGRIVASGYEKDNWWVVADPL